MSAREGVYLLRAQTPSLQTERAEVFPAECAGDYVVQGESEGVLWRKAEMERCEVCGGGLEEGVEDAGEGLHNGC